MLPIGAASGGEPTSMRTLSTSSSTSSRRSPAACGAQLRVERRNEPDRELALCRAHCDPRCDRRDRLVADVLVDQVGSGPERVDVDACREPEPGERLGRCLGRDAVHRQRHRIDDVAITSAPARAASIAAASAFPPAPCA